MSFFDTVMHVEGGTEVERVAEELTKRHAVRTFGGCAGCVHCCPGLAEVVVLHTVAKRQ